MIWCVDDDNTIREIEVYTLTQTGFEAKGFADGLSMLEALKTEQPELIVLDIMMPGMDGIDVLKVIRSKPETRRIPVIMATAKGTEMDKIHGLDTGADDYLVKPFGVMEMVSRIKAVLRRCEPEEVGDVLKVAEITLNDKEHTVSVNGEKVALTFKEFELLKMFMSNPVPHSPEINFCPKFGALIISGNPERSICTLKRFARSLANPVSVLRLLSVLAIGWRPDNDKEDLSRHNRRCNDGSLGQPTSCNNLLAQLL